MSYFGALASMFGSSGGGGRSGGGGLVSTSSTGQSGPANNTSVNFNGPSGGASDGLGMLLSLANGGSTANGGLGGNRPFDAMRFAAGPGAVPMVLILAGVGAVLVFLVVKKK